MKPRTTDEVLDVMDAYLTSAALSSALELGLFWLLDERPSSVVDLAAVVGIPGDRCRFLLQILVDQGLVEQIDGGFVPTEVARRAIIGAYSKSTWSVLARMAAERVPVILELKTRILDPASTWKARGLTPPNYFERVASSTEAAWDYTRMLYELHLPLAEAIAEHLNVGNARRILDLGGGSGVVSIALLRRHPALRAEVADIANVCEEGRKIAREQGIADRLSFRAIDFVRNDLPVGNDIVLACDTGPYSETLFGKVRASLSGAGRLVMVEQFPGDAEGDAIARPWLTWAFRASLHDAYFSLPSLADVQPFLERAGLRILARDILPAKGDIRWCRGWSMIQAGI